MKTWRIETGSPGYADVVKGRPFQIMPGTTGMSAGDLLEVTVVRLRGYECKTVRVATHVITKVLPGGNITCGAITGVEPIG